MSGEKTETYAERLKKYKLKNRFFNFLKETKKYKEPLWTKEAAFTFIITLIVSYLYFFPNSFSNVEPEKLNEIMGSLNTFGKEYLKLSIGGLFALLGFTISGLAIVTGTISDTTVKRINEKKRIPALLSVMFNFYFCGAIVGFTIILHIFSILYLNLDIVINFNLFKIFTFINIYFLIFSLIYSVMLLGTCIRLFILKHENIFNQ